MNSFFRKVEGFLINLLVIILIILISSQFLMKNEVAYQRIKELEVTARSWLNQERVVEVTQPLPTEAAYLTVDLLQDLSLPQVWLLKNGERVANFRQGVVRIKVKEGDLISLDTSYYSQALWFEITALSANINTWAPGKQFRSYREEKVLGVVRFYGQV